MLTQCASAGLIGWVPNTDTLHALIREYRDARKIPLNVEHRLMLGMAPDYENLTVIQKVEVFEHALESTSGMALLLPLQLLQAYPSCTLYSPSLTVQGTDTCPVSAPGYHRLRLVSACKSQRGDWAVSGYVEGHVACTGEDLHKVLWLKSRSSEVWLERRTHYTRSCAVMSMVRLLLPASCLQEPCCILQAWHVPFSRWQASRCGRASWC